VEPAKDATNLFALQEFLAGHIHSLLFRKEFGFSFGFSL